MMRIDLLGLALWGDPIIVGDVVFMPARWFTNHSLDWVNRQEALQWSADINRLRGRGAYWRYRAAISTS